MAVKSVEKAKKRARRCYRIRRKLQSKGDRLRVAVFKSSKYTYAQVIDDIRGVTVAAVSTKCQEVVGSCEGHSTKSVEAAKVAGKVLGAKLVEKGLTRGIFDRSGFLYAGRVKALADGLRESGVQI
jgi:large subunit ribosomal protein L18